LRCSNNFSSRENQPETRIVFRQADARLGLFVYQIHAVIRHKEPNKVAGDNSRCPYSLSPALVLVWFFGIFKVDFRRLYLSSGRSTSLALFGWRVFVGSRHDEPAFTLSGAPRLEAEIFARATDAENSEVAKVEMVAVFDWDETDSFAHSF
jgi:hypothetical protein